MLKMRIETVCRPFLQKSTETKKFPYEPDIRPLLFGKNSCESGNHGGQRVGYNEGMPGRMVREALRLLKHEWRPV